MHISEGVLAAPVLVAGATLTAAGTAAGLRKLDYDKIPQTAVLTSAFFIASLVHVPIGPANAHLVLNGLVGLLLGWVAFPAVLVALCLQAVLFQYGGITSLGVNTLIMALPAVLCYGLFRSVGGGGKGALSSPAAFVCGATGVLAGSLLAALALVSTGRPFVSVAKVLIVAHIPVMLIEGFITTVTVKFLKKVRPEILGGTYGF
jgi:cobalt/nickel transport system permease protein